MTNQVTYSISLLPENAAKIDQVNRILLGEAYTQVSTDNVVSSTTTFTAKAEKPNKTKSEKAEKPKEESTAYSVNDLKVAAKAAKKDHSEDFVNGVLDDAGVKEAASLGRRMSAVDEDDYGDIIAALNAGPMATEQASDEPSDDDWGDEDDGANIDPEAVKTAIKAYGKEVSRDAAKKVMNDNGAKLLSDVDKCSQKQLTAMMNELL